MGKPVPVSGMTSNEELENSMVATTKLTRMTETDSGGVKGNQTHLTVGQKESGPDLGAMSADQDFRQGIHGSGKSEQGGAMPALWRKLIPEQPEAIPRPEVSGGEGKNIGMDNLDTHATAKPNQETLG
jgi:hypothetical protein